jgi:hypothetical protein
LPVDAGPDVRHEVEHLEEPARHAHALDSSEF